MAKATLKKKLGAMGKTAMGYIGTLINIIIIIVIIIIIILAILLGARFLVNNNWHGYHVKLAKKRNVTPLSKESFLNSKKKMGYEGTIISTLSDMKMAHDEINSYYKKELAK